MTTAERVNNALANSPLSKQPKILKLIAEKIDAYEATKHHAGTSPKLVKRPHALYCSVSGIKCGCTATAYFEKKLFEYGDDIFVLMTTYVSRGARGNVPRKAASSAPAVKVAKSEPAPDTVIVSAPVGNDEYTQVTAWKDENQSEPLITTTTFEVNGVAKVIFDYNHDSGKTVYRLGSQTDYSDLKSR